MADKPVVATVTKVVKPRGKKPYAVTVAKGVEGSITFSLSGNVWHEETEPTTGAVVVLSGLILKKRGWRASHGRFFQPSDQQPQK